MRAIDEINMIQVASITNQDMVRETLARLFWEWFESAKNRKVTTIKIFGIFRKTIYIKDLREVFILLFGAP